MNLVALVSPVPIVADPLPPSPAVESGSRADDGFFSLAARCEQRITMQQKPLCRPTERHSLSAHNDCLRAELQK